MLRQIIGFGPASLLPAVSSFAFVYVFTRILPRSEFGSYTLALNAVMLCQSILFYPLAASTARLYPFAHLNGTIAILMKSSYNIFGILSVGILSVLVIIAFLPVQSVWLVVPMLLILRGMINVNQDVNRMAGRMTRYNVIVGTDALVGLSAALIVVWLAPSASSILLGLCISSLCCVAIDGSAVLAAVRIGHVDRLVTREIGHLASPLMLTFTLNAILLYGDRFIVAGMLSTDELATYAVASALVIQPITMIGSAIAISTGPLAMHALDTKGFEAGQTQGMHNGLLVVALIIPACAGLAVCHEQIAALMTGAQFQAAVSTMIPFIAGIALLRAVSMSYFESAFYLAKRTDLMVYAYAPAAIVNVGMNLILVRSFGINGILTTAAISQCLMLAGIVILGRRVFPLSLPMNSLGKIVIASIIMMLVINLLHAPTTWFGFIEQIVVGGGVYGGIMIAADGIGLRTWIRRLV